MVQANAASSASADYIRALPARFLAAYRWMLLARVTEEKIAALYRGGKITGGVFLSKGQEALSAASGMALRKANVFAFLHPRPGRAAGLRRIAARLHAHLHGLAPRSHARTRRRRTIGPRPPGRALSPLIIPRRLHSP